MSEADALLRATGFARGLTARLETATRFGSILLPSPGFYTGIFAWDSAWHYFFLKELDGERAVVELETLYATSDAEGRVPHETLFDRRPPEGVLRRLQVRFLESTYAPDGRSLFVDPPVYAWAAADAVLSGLVSGERAATLLDGAAKALRFFRRERTLSFADYPYHELPVILHPLESGTDASPQFDEIYGGLAGLIASMITLPRRLSRVDWNPERAVAAGIPAIYDVTLVSFYLLGLVQLEQARSVLAARGGWANRGAVNRDAVNGGGDELPSGEELSGLVEAAGAVFLDRDQTLFTSHWVRADTIRRCSTATLSGVLPLLVPGMVPNDVRDGIVARHLQSGGTFVRSLLPRYTVPRRSRVRARRPEPRRERFSSLLWRGPCSWMNMSFCVSLILQSTGRDEAAARLGEHALAAVERTGPYEFLHCDGTSGGGAKPFSWNGLVLPMVRPDQRMATE